MFVERDWLKTGNLKIDFQMILQVFTNSSALGNHRHASRLQDISWPYAGTLQNLWRIDRS